MEETLKARLIGAAVLVAIAVLLIPELLSGRKATGPAPGEGTGARGTRTFTIELGGAPGESARSPTTLPVPQPGASQVQASTPPPRSSAAQPEPEVDQAAEPAPQPDAQSAGKEAPAEPAGGSPPAAAMTRTVEAPPSAAVSAPRPDAAAPVAGGAWVVQVGAFGSADSARKLVKELTGAGYRAYVAPVTRSGKTLHRVRVGPEADRARAEQLAKGLKGRGLPATVVAND